MDARREGSSRVEFVYSGILKGHNGWITKISVAPTKADTIISSSRDKRLILWKIAQDNGKIYGTPLKSLEGHNHFVSHCEFSKDSRHVISASWDNTLRMWDIEKNICVSQFKDHTSDVLAVGFSAHNRQIFSASRDGTIKLWNIRGVLKYTFETETGSCFQGSVTCLAISPLESDPIFASGSSDKTIRLWNYSVGYCAATYYGHNNQVNAVCFSSDAAFLASGCKDGVLNVWDTKKHKNVASHRLTESITCLSFIPKTHIILVGAGSKVYFFLFDPVKNMLVENIKPISNIESVNGSKDPAQVTTLTMSHGSDLLYVGCNDNCIRIYQPLTAPN